MVPESKLAIARMSSIRAERRRAAPNALSTRICFVSSVASSQVAESSSRWPRTSARGVRTSCPTTPSTSALSWLTLLSRSLTRAISRFSACEDVTSWSTPVSLVTSASPERSARTRLNTSRTSPSGRTIR